jgi:hypothetical protein
LGNRNYSPGYLPKITLHPRTLEEKKKRVRTSSSIREAMRNLTVTIPGDAYRRARVWAAERDTSLSAVVRHLIETLPGINRSNSAFPIPNQNHSSNLPAADSPNPKQNFAVFTGETVETHLTYSISIT